MSRPEEVDRAIGIAADFKLSGSLNRNLSRLVDAARLLANYIVEEEAKHRKLWEGVHGYIEDEIKRLSHATPPSENNDMSGDIE